MKIVVPDRRLSLSAQLFERAPQIKSSHTVTKCVYKSLTTFASLGMTVGASLDRPTLAPACAQGRCLHAFQQQRTCRLATQGTIILCFLSDDVEVASCSRVS